MYISISISISIYLYIYIYIYIYTNIHTYKSIHTAYNREVVATYQILHIIISRPAPALN